MRFKSTIITPLEDHTVVTCTGQKLPLEQLLKSSTLHVTPTVHREFNYC